VRAAIYAIGILVGVLVIGALLIDEGEVVTVMTRDAEGQDFETQLWIVQIEGIERIEGASYLRANSPSSDWLARARLEPAVELRRGETIGRWRIVPESDPELRRRVNQAMAEKYGLSDRLLVWLFDPAEMVPLRLEPAEGEVVRGAHGR
jgi:hypothetical protein